jgi:predicted ATP-grasp superfamily ATP-dependent carboligase
LELPIADRLTARHVTGPGVLLVDAGERSAVAACECLARAGYRVGTASSERNAPAAWSRFSNASYSLPNPRLDGFRFSELLAEIAAEDGYATALACSEGSLWAISTNRDAFENALDLGLPPKEVVVNCTDKLALIGAATAAGLAAPETAVCQTDEEAIAAAVRIGFPVVLKPRRTVLSHAGEIRHLASALIGDAESLQARLGETGLPCLIQRREPGSVISCGGVMADGRLLAATVSRYLRTWPSEGGPVSFSQSIEAQPPLLDSVARLVASLGWSGIFELEMIELANGSKAVLDFNPRIYGSLALAVKAGAPLPAIWCDWLLNGRETRGHGRPGVFYRWEDADLRNSLELLRAGRPLRAISVWRPRSPTAHAYFRWYDPVPAAVRALKFL